MEEDFANWRVTALPASRGRVPENTAPLEQLKPAHLTVDGGGAAGADLATQRWAGLYGGVMLEVTGDDIHRSDGPRYAALTGSVMVEIWG